jgi:arylformamidase
VPIRSGMAHWPGNPPVVVTRVKDLARGDSSSVSLLSLGTHTGTHVDAPAHFVRGGLGVDAMPYEAVNGPARVVEVRGAGPIGPEALDGARRGERVLFKTRNSARWREAAFMEDFTYLSTEAGLRAARLRVRAVGVDYLSVGGYKRNGADVHRALLEGGVWIIEGLDLSRIRPGRHELACLPLRIEGGDGAPARAMLRRRP